MMSICCGCTLAYTHRAGSTRPCTFHLFACQAAVILKECISDDQAPRVDTARGKVAAEVSSRQHACRSCSRTPGGTVAGLHVVEV